MKQTKLDKAYAEIEKFKDCPERQKDIGLAYALLSAHRQLGATGNGKEAIVLTQNFDHAVGAIYDRVGNFIYALAFRLCGNDSSLTDGLMQGFFVKKLKKIACYEGSTSLAEFFGKPLIEQIKRQKDGQDWLKRIKDKIREAVKHAPDEGVPNPIPFPGLRADTPQSPVLPPGTNLKFGGKERGRS